MKKHLSSAVALAVSVAATLTLSAGPASAGDPVDQTERWLAKQLDGGLVHNDQFDFDDYGLSIDVGLALQELGQTRTAKTVRKAIAKNVDSYTTGADFGSSDIYANATAKAAVFAQATGADPASFGGVDLVKRLSKRVAGSAPVNGRIQDKGASDFANVIGQAYAVQALTEAGAKKAGKATTFLLSQQCKAGYFRLNFTEDKTAADQTCDGGKRKTTSAPDTDTTALAVLALLEDPTPTKPVRAAVSRALAWLTKTQGTNGSFGGGPSTETPNANSTGLAASALGAAGACDKANRAAKWLSRLTVSGVSGENGAIAYDKAAKATAKDGISVEERDQFIRSTAQAAPALVYVIIDGCD
ncbi:hypothetical protein [Nocardioides sp.]|uniref:hypothetical protein n=1 Tax=Nocardioides sp. TaxID=35761 RepID=UPI001A2CC1AB|nr:hypothetical protein [Nocardioides sp.]MBJ7359650.1 hypothetical protein [Nocardioides sp.]